MYETFPKVYVNGQLLCIIAQYYTFSKSPPEADGFLLLYSNGSSKKFMRKEKLGRKKCTGEKSYCRSKSPL